MVIIRLFLVVIIVLLNALPAIAEERITLSDLIAELIQSNPDLQAATLRYQAANVRPSREGALPDPQVRFGWMSAGSMIPGRGLGEDPNANIGVQISQMFPYPGKRDLRADVAHKEAASEKEMYAATAQSRIAALKAAFYDLTFVYEAIDLLHENKDLLGRLTKVADARYSTGQASQQDLIKAAIEVSILENRLLLQEQKKRSLVAEINSLLNRSVTGSLGRPEKVTAPELEPYEILQTRLREKSPVLLAQQSRIESRDARVRLARKEKYPDFDVMGGYFNQGEMTDMWEMQFTLSIPVWFERKQKKEEEEAALMLSEAKQSYRAAEQMLQSRLQDAYAKAETSRKLTDLYSKRIVPQSRVALESSLASYETGAVDFLTVLSNFMTILEYRISYFEQQAEYLKALAVLEELTLPEVQS